LTALERIGTLWIKAPNLQMTILTPQSVNFC